MPKQEARDTKEAILNVALKLFSERGYRSSILFRKTYYDVQSTLSKER